MKKSLTREETLVALCRFRELTRQGHLTEDQTFEVLDICGPLVDTYRARINQLAIERGRVNLGLARIVARIDAQWDRWLTSLEDTNSQAQ